MGSHLSVSAAGPSTVAPPIGVPPPPAPGPGGQNDAAASAQAAAPPEPQPAPETGPGTFEDLHKRCKG